ncbi:hypothetical protein TFKS16_0510 [Tannerella forsythia KS16]|uniref:Uncharacterized protein n=1 Tax=Tannerella forsythia (strain ATCC 43037 / JCM 10827 / CCUG 21028 A / KCTC 5666 / FDC 338) TaxID=203275 RepID=G8UKI2_TANFA|nr:hypothetical protein BFO_0429 [Tannerella forsythia 92A2]BAR47956.1 hypothetical protein TF3313_0367 [Tannerella forsythia 3313]BAR50821.1 hypothetical protein TFKS16_0510 [Tannerella forsythia KS16]
MIHIVVLSSQKKKSRKCTARPRLFQKKVIALIDASPLFSLT